MQVAGGDNRAGILLGLFLPVVGWVVSSLSLYRVSLLLKMCCSYVAPAEIASLLPPCSH